MDIYIWIGENACFSSVNPCNFAVNAKHADLADLRCTTNIYSLNLKPFS